MDTSEKLYNLNTLYKDLSYQLSNELLKGVPDRIILTTCRKQLAELDKDIRRVQIRKDMWG
jgi:hypothetical protein